MNMMLTDNRDAILPAASTCSQQSLQAAKFTKPQFDLLQPVRQWLDQIEVRDAKFAKLLYKVIPAQCPFERDIILFGHKVAHIPPLCKLNPLYDQLVGLRFRALCYLVDRCGIDIMSYS
ncbi:MULTISPECIES: Mo-dependent nitrogenase C-terminal domain-containing protein [Aerosakkonema]|uniref:Mo-dependent nitrogenase C-terminal domain-containing protein n=1 Tax=Aerosakkonema TaxID=1246629 RepID=UPI0035B8D27E